MEPFNTNQNPIAAGSQMPVAPGGEPKQKKPVGPIAGAVIVIVLLVAGGLYFWGAKINQGVDTQVPFIPGDDTAQENNESDLNAGLPPQSESDDVSSIEADFNAMDMSELESQNEAELNNI